MYGYAIQSSFSGNAIGVLDVQASCDPVTVDFTNRIVNWSTIATFPLTAPGSVMYNVDAAHYKFARLLYTRTSGSGSIIANMHAKGV